MNKSTLIILLVFINLTDISGQTWPKVYINPYSYSNASCAFDSYDDGITILSDISYGTAYASAGWLIKTNINGDILWERSLGSLSDYFSRFNMMKATRDSGIIIAYVTKYAELDPFYMFGDAAFMKLNPCGELDWCKIIHDPGIENVGMNVVETNNGYVGMYGTLYPGGSPPYTYENSNTLVKFNKNGQIQWKLNYDDTLLSRETWWDILLLRDSTFLITGIGNYYDSTLLHWFEKPLKICIDMEGNILDYSILYKNVDSIENAQDYSTIESARGRLYSAGITERMETLRKQSLFEENPEFFPFSDSLSYATSLCWIQDSTIVISGVINSTEAGYEGWVIVQNVDTSGSVLNSRRLLYDDFLAYTFFVSTTRDNKILASGYTGYNPNGPPLNTMLFKLTPTFEDDVYDPTPRVYDYACPDEVASHDTIGMEECDIVVNAEQLATLPDVAVMEVYPNPVSGAFQVRLPEFVALRNQNKGLNTALHQSNYQQSSTLQVFDLDGQIVTEEKLTQGQMVVQFDASNWTPGMYLLRLVYKDKTVGSAKVVK